MMHTNGRHDTCMKGGPDFWYEPCMGASTIYAIPPHYHPSLWLVLTLPPERGSLTMQRGATACNGSLVRRGSLTTKVQDFEASLSISVRDNTREEEYVELVRENHQQHSETARGVEGPAPGLREGTGASRGLSLLPSHPVGRARSRPARVLLGPRRGESLRPGNGAQQDGSRSEDRRRGGNRGSRIERSPGRAERGWRGHVRCGRLDRQAEATQGKRGFWLTLSSTVKGYTSL